ncbi:MAG: archaeosortase/exosortase family protein [Planctomycetota bacterium]
MGGLSELITKRVLWCPRSAPALLLIGHLPMLVKYYADSWSYPLYGAMIPATIALAFVALRRCGGRVQTSSVLGFVLIVADLLLAAAGLWRGSAWMVSLGAACCGAAWLCGRGALTEPRWMLAITLLLALLVRLPPGMDMRLQRSFDERVTGTATSILNTTGVMHYRESGLIRLERVSLQPALARGGLASAWCLPVLACLTAAWLGRSVIHQLILLPLAAVLGVITAVANTVLAAHLAVWFDMDLSGGVLSLVYRLNWLIPGALLVWSGDRLMKFLLDGIPEMQRTVAGKLERVRENEDGELVVTARNPVIAVWNNFAAPWPDSVASGLVSAPLYYGRASAHRTAKSGSRRARSEKIGDVVRGEAQVFGLGYLSRPAAVVALLLAAAQIVRLLGVGAGL